MRRIKGSGFSARRHTRICILSPDAARALSQIVNVIFNPSISALLVDEDSAPILIHSALLSSSVL